MTGRNLFIVKKRVVEVLEEENSNSHQTNWDKTESLQGLWEDQAGTKIFEESGILIQEFRKLKMHLQSKGGGEKEVRNETKGDQRPLSRLTCD